ncbi:type VI toxin-antitoxin system SocA family antitoxin [Desertibaculum subflavum]|uniref:type VI toxin-antitoxin system SocA family antitoxin n=1 Tax=Desertibaculum subflavum TaxID=2268458 RepID=UPI000E65FFA7
MTVASYDPRSIANLMLDEADRVGIAITNLALQKLLYFAHGIFLNENKKPLVSGYFEAWQYGPVHPTAYKAFQVAGPDPIRFRACSQNVLSGELSPIAPPDNREVRRLVQHVLNSYGKLSAGRLVDISHAKNSPWEHIVHKGRTSVAFGLRIPDTVILERFKHHKVSIGDAPVAGEPREDTPFCLILTLRASHRCRASCSAGN